MTIQSPSTDHLIDQAFLCSDLLADAKTVKKLRPNDNLDIISDDEEDLKRKERAKAQAASKKKVVFFK